MVAIENSPDGKYNLWPDSILAEFAAYALEDGCGESISNLARMDDEANQIDMRLSAGVVLMDLNDRSLAFSMEMPLGTARAQAGVFMTAYDPDRDMALIQAYSHPVRVDLSDGSFVNLKPREEIQVSSRGGESREELPHAFLPMVK